MTYQFIPGAADNIALITDHAALDHYSQTADPRAFEVLTLRYQSMVLATCRRVLGNSTDADDAVQETFLRLARNAADVRSNVAAWLHACALRISIDQQRKQSAQRRAEEKATRAAAMEAAGSDSTSTWRELEPLIDEALSKLHESDRDLIVSRFLVGRSQAEMAAEEGVNPGTIHRRLDAALGRLRTHLKAGGCVLGAGAIVTALNVAPSTAQAAPALGASLGKIGLSQVATAAGAAKAAGVGATAWIAATVAGVVITGTAGMLLFTQPAATPPPPAPTPVVATPTPAKVASLLGDSGSSFARPTKEVTGFTLLEYFTESPASQRLYFDGPNVYLGPDATQKKTKNGVMLTIASIEPDAKPAKVKFRGTAIGKEVNDRAKEMIGKEIDATYEIVGRRLTVTGEFDPGQGVQKNRAVRPAPGSSIDKAGSATGSDAALAGAWIIVDGHVLTLTADEITLTYLHSDSPAERYRIMEWTEAEGGGYAKVQVICTAYGQTRGAVGKRMKLLIRKDDKLGYSMLSFDPDSEKRDTWPEKFEYTPDKQMRALVFRKE